tara:strand:- start:90989 stop:91471 length:483 start_codon:yes stop_codon:yes gene_type:complete
MIEIVVAASENGVIGKEDSLPWKQRADMQRFRQITMGHPVIMGRKTYESIPSDLEGRYQVVLTRDAKYFVNGETIVAHSPEEALDVALDIDNTVFIIGGEEVYNLFLEKADTIHLTRIHADIEGDAFFDVPEDWILVEDNMYPPDNKNQYGYSFQIYKRA